MAEEIFEIYQLMATLRSRQTSGQEDISETEYITLNVLARGGQMTVGEVQKRIGVAPAQMSRIVRALEENGGRGYVECQINPRDRRCVDISLTAAGRKAHARFRAARLESMYAFLSVLPPEDRVHFMRIIGQIRGAFEQRLALAMAQE